MGITVSAVMLAVLYVAVGGRDGLSQIGTAMLDARPLPMALAVVVYGGAVWLRAARWHHLVRPFADVPTGRLFAVMMIGFSVNNVLPFRLGEVVRTVLVHASHQVPLSATLASILVERALDVWVLCLLMTVVFLNAPLPGWLDTLGSVSTLVAVAGILGGLAVVVVGRSLDRVLYQPIIRLGARGGRRVEGLLRSLISGLRAIEQPSAFIRIAVLSMLCWIAELGLYYLVMVGFSFDSGILSMMAGMVVANLATVLPSSPGYVGTFDVPLHLTLSQAFGVPDGLAASFTLTAHTLLLVPVVIFGMALLAREDLSLHALIRGQIKPKESATPPSRT
ncbi:MAG: lysylphosphatidylglycerol synthase transmembrane domain-containing protein [Chloroflexota bacterium]